MRIRGILAPEGRHKDGCAGPSGLNRSVLSSPVAHATGRGCAGLPALTEIRHFKADSSGWDAASTCDPQSFNRKPRATVILVQLRRRLAVNDSLITLSRTAYSHVPARDSTESLWISAAGSGMNPIGRERLTIPPREEPGLRPGSHLVAVLRAQDR